ncbi:hypothetical protein QR685DRAFT_534617 [Neurospora intermedia]|uniref:Uncharacterized protein n=1 Tax=Neurospora intermedia TaxID=5142 RepID=A0ABR3D2D8_NEUIN
MILVSSLAAVLFFSFSRFLYILCRFTLVSLSLYLLGWSFTGLARKTCLGGRKGVIRFLYILCFFLETTLVSRGVYRLGWSSTESA